MPAKKFLSKDDVLRAIRSTLSNRAAARYLGVGYHLYRDYAKLYKDDESGLTLFEKHKNQQGKGIPKWQKNGPTGGKMPKILDIVEGRVNHAHFTPQRIKDKLIQEGYLAEECAICKFADRRVIDYKMPLLIHFKDGNKRNYANGNLELLCYNCYFISVGNIYNEKDLMQIEGHTHVNSTNTEMVEFELDEYHIERLRSLGLWEHDNNTNGEEFISKW
jgi:hypothetical protein